MNDLGLAKGSVRLVKHNPKWKELFEAEKKLLLEKFPETILQVSHGGSTAIPTILAKPILDIFAIVSSLADADTIKEDLEKLGYTYLGEEGVPERRLAVKGPAEKRTIHLQLVEEGSKEWKNHIILREYYLRHPEVAQEYAELKKKLAQQFPDDRKSYTSSKNTFIKGVLERASAGSLALNKRTLSTVTLLGIDCIDFDRLLMAAEICQEHIEFAEVKLLTSLDVSHKDAVKINPINSVEEYSLFILSQLDKYVTSDHVLIIQYDGFILNPESWTDRYLNYDYIGAPWLVADWSVKNFDFPASLLGQLVVGNGGFSLRSKKLISLCAQLFQERLLPRYHPEDVAIGVYYRKLLEDKGINFSPVSLAKQFSFEHETEDNNSWNGQFGFHGLKWTDISKWLLTHPKYVFDADKKTLRRK